MDLNEARRTGLPIVVGGSSDPDDARPDLVDVESPYTAVADADTEGLTEEEAPRTVLMDGATAAGLVQEVVPPPPMQPAAPASSVDGQVAHLLHRLGDIEARLRQKMRLDDIQAAVDRIDALLK